MERDRIDFVMKHHVIHNRSSDHFPAGFQQQLAPEQRVSSLWWESSFEFRERVFVSAEQLDPYVAEFVAQNRQLVDVPRPNPVRRVAGKVRRRLRRRAES